MSHINTPLFQLDVKRQCLFCYDWFKKKNSFATIPFQCQSLVPVCLRTGSPTRSYFRCVSSDLLTIIFGFVIILATSQFPINNRPSWPNCWRLDDRVLSAIHCRSENDARAKVTSCPETRPGRRDLQAALNLSLSLFHCLVRAFLVTCHVTSTPSVSVSVCVSWWWNVDLSPYFRRLTALSLE